MNRRSFLASLIALPAAMKALVLNPPNPFVVPVTPQTYMGDLQWHKWNDAMVGPHDFGAFQYKIYKQIATTSPWDNLVK